MMAYALRRILGAIPTLFVIVTLTFFMMRAAPGGPFDSERRLPPEVERNVKAAYDLDKPVLQQYFLYLGKLAHGDLGPSYKNKDFTVAQLIGAGLPVMLAIVVALLMIQLQRFSLTFMVLVTAPLGIIGVAAALLASGRPFGFVALLGTLALGGMIMRNTVILVDQIRQYQAEGHGVWESVRESAVRRFRPILLTAAAAVLAMVPLSRDVLWGPMAFAIMGGLIVATIMTVLFVPALYVAWYRVRPD